MGAEVALEELRQYSGYCAISPRGRVAILPQYQSWITVTLHRMTGTQVTYIFVQLCN